MQVINQGKSAFVFLDEHERAALKVILSFHMAREVAEHGAPRSSCFECAEKLYRGLD